MKFLLLATALFLGPGLFAAETVFPGLKAILTAAEWKRAGLDRLSPDEIGVIDAALIRREAGANARQESELAAARTAAANVATAARTDQTPGLLQRFGLPAFDDRDWRALPALKAKVVQWVSANRFALDNGQVWEGHEAIVYDLVGKDIEIQARPHGQFALVVEGANTTVRVVRLR